MLECQPCWLTFPQWRHYGQFFLGRLEHFLWSMTRTHLVCVCVRAVFTLVEKHRAKSFYRSLVYQLSQLWPCSFYIIARTDPKKPSEMGGFTKNPGIPSRVSPGCFNTKSMDPWIYGRTGWWGYHPLENTKVKGLGQGISSEMARHSAPLMCESGAQKSHWRLGIFHRSRSIQVKPPRKIGQEEAPIRPWPCLLTAICYVNLYQIISDISWISLDTTIIFV